jgi:hypothetical protein
MFRSVLMEPKAAETNIEMVWGGEGERQANEYS